MNWTLDFRNGEWTALRCGVPRFGGSYRDAEFYAWLGRTLDP